jgi:signal transduction histidine kinase
MYVPVYRNGAAVDTTEQRKAALLGWSYSPYRMDDLMGGILKHWENEEGQAIDLHIYDGEQATPAALLFDSKPATAANVDSLFYQQRRIDFGGRQWLLVFDYRINDASLNYANAWFVLIGGMVVSGLLLGLMLSLINTQSNAERIANDLVAKIADREASLEQQAAVLTRANAELTRANAELTRLGEVMAHHFQEPVRRMASFAQRLLARSDSANDADSRQSLTFINQQARRLSELVRDARLYLAIDHAKVGAGETADSGDVLRRSIAEAGAEAAGANITVLEPLPMVRLAEKALAELFSILLDNAQRYRHPERGLHIAVSASVAGDRALFRFADNGSGIAPEYREQVFELFTRLVPNSIPGTGMGLALVRKIVQQAGGNVRVEDGLDGGACIVFDLPVETHP